MTFTLLPGSYSVYRLSADKVPEADFAREDFFSFARTTEEVSVVCRSGLVEGAMKEDGGWRVLKIAGPIDFGVVGVLAGASGLLAAVGVSIFVVSTFDTDYILVKEACLDGAIGALEGGGHSVEEAG
ncbi:MAG: ACT domain-containing protein [Spirochaetes bacterium]|nr:ACT domain-containing protein [Spirochaetota bacterium]